MTATACSKTLLNGFYVSAGWSPKRTGTDCTGNDLASLHQQVRQALNRVP
ncbi:MAG: hypothetical protein JHC40_14985 [Burkholderiales bacterium]|jgi:hypothetical protein|nr:hypothetical protein [Burkholderiales bacterium]